jgi:uncharacterized membrane protein
MATDQMPVEARPRRLRTQRLEAFSDGVFAIAITLLVLDLAVPASSANDALGAIAHEWPAYLAYVVSFATVGALWLGHRAVTDYLQGTDPVFTRLNLLLLLVVAFLPFPTRLLAEYIRAAGAERVATTVYGITLFLAAALLSLLWRYAVRAELVRPDADDAELADRADWRRAVLPDRSRGRVLADRPVLHPAGAPQAQAADRRHVGRRAPRRGWRRRYGGCCRGLRLRRRLGCRRPPTTSYGLRPTPRRQSPRSGAERVGPMAISVAVAPCIARLPLLRATAAAPSPRHFLDLC